MITHMGGWAGRAPAQQAAFRLCALGNTIFYSYLFRPSITMPPLSIAKSISICIT